MAGVYGRRPLLRLRDISQARAGHLSPFLSGQTQFNRDQCGFDRRADRAVIGEGWVFQFHGRKLRQDDAEGQLRRGGR